MAPSPWSIGGAAAAAPSAATVARIVVPAPGEGCSVDMRAPSSAASSSLVVAIGGKGPTARCPSRPCTSGCANGSLSICTLKKCICCDALPGRSNEEKWAALKAVGSSIRGSGWALSGPDSSWECRAAQSRQARPEEAQEPSGGTTKGALRAGSVARRQVRQDREAVCRRERPPLLRGSGRGLGVG